MALAARLECPASSSMPPALYGRRARGFADSSPHGSRSVCMVTQAVIAGRRDGRLPGYETGKGDAVDEGVVAADALPPEAQEDGGAAEELRQARVPAFGLREVRAVVNCAMGLGVRPPDMRGGSSAVMLGMALGRAPRFGAGRCASTSSRVEDAQMSPSGSRGVTPRKAAMFLPRHLQSMPLVGADVWGAGLSTGVLPIANERSPNIGVPPSNGDLVQTLVAQHWFLLQTLLQQVPSQRTDLEVLSGSYGSGASWFGGA